MKNFLLVIAFMQGFILSSQTLSGVVLNEKGNPLPNALVYFDGTTFGTQSDANGNFTISYKTIINPILVVSYPGCKSVFKSEFYDGIKLRMWPVKKNKLMKETKIAPFDRKAALKVFRNQFLGISEGAKKCVFLNEDAIKFAYDSKNFVLYAFANERIKIQNNYLGYEIDFELIEFYAIFEEKTARQDALVRSHFSGTSFFKELNSSEINFERNREFSYYGSTKHFFRNMIEKRWGMTDFVLLESNFRVNPNEVFDIKKGTDIFEVRLMEETKQGRGASSTPFSYKSYNVIYNDKKQSTIIFRTNNFQIDMFGNHSKSNYIELSGELTRSLFGNFLPLDFVLEY
jgi:hypothetical protein